MRSIFGWSYPPGAANDPNAPWNQEDPPCDVCGMDCYSCVCPECHICGVSGDPLCYEYHGLVRSQAQIDGMAALEEQERQRAEADRAEAEHWADPQRKVEEEEMQKYWNDLAAYQAGEA